MHNNNHRNYIPKHSIHSGEHRTLTSVDLSHEIYSNLTNAFQNYIISLKRQNLSSEKFYDSIENRFDMLNTLSDTNKLAKYNLDLSVKEIHYFKSDLNGDWFPVYINLNFFNLWLETSQKYLYNTIVNGLSDKGYFLNGSESLHFNYKLSLLYGGWAEKIEKVLTEKYNLEYTDGAFYIPELYKGNYQDNYTGIYNIFKSSDTSKINVIDEAVNNYYYRIFIHKVIFPEGYGYIDHEESDNIDVWMFRVADRAIYLKDIKQDKETLPLDDIYKLLHINNNNVIDLHVYDKHNIILIERSRDYSTTNDNNSVYLDDVLEEVSSGESNIFSASANDISTNTDYTGSVDS